MRKNTMTGCIDSSASSLRDYLAGRYFRYADFCGPSCDPRTKYRSAEKWALTTIDAIIEEEGERKYQSMRWSLIPSWWSKPLKEMKMATFNARAETVDTKPMFKSAWQLKKRCIIPVSGYYEWQTIEGDKPQPWYFTNRDGSPIISVAGIWDEWRDKQRKAEVLRDDHHRAE